ncbi:hypothetical protein [Pedobacter miscanthi]|nr:hypothetical protein [Pedobacter miscanthi]
MKKQLIKSLKPIKLRQQITLNIQALLIMLKETTDLEPFIPELLVVL